MTAEPGFRRVQIYVARNGKAPFTQWMHSLRDKQTKARILTRIDRIRLGNLGDCESVGAGVYEVRIHARDIEMAKSYWREFNEL
jgi:putative component of toxin-antitoxin plasmid stabilization module